MTMTLRALLTGFVSLALLAGCGEKKGEKTRKEAAPAGPKEKIDPAQTGGIKGVVRFEGTVPKSRELPIAEPACRQMHSGPVQLGDVLVKDGKLQNVFVHVDGLGKYDWPAPTGTVTVDQKGCLYEPLVVGVRVGQDFKFLNSDPVLHNVHTLPEENDGENFPMPAGMKERTTKFTEPEIMIKTKCDVHPWMRAYIGVVDHPKFAVTGEDGAFSFEGVPAGEFTVKTWHERYGEKAQTVTVEAGKTAEVELVYSGN